MDFKLYGKVAFVTGGSHGLGRDICLELAQEGANVAINYRNDHDRAAQLANEISTYCKTQAITVCGDVSKEQEVKDMFETIIQHFGKIDILVNNAGICPVSMIKDMSLSEWNNVMATNLTGVFLTTREMINVSLKRESETSNSERSNLEKTSAETSNSERISAETSNAEINNAETSNVEINNAETSNVEINNAEINNAEINNAERTNSEADVSRSKYISPSAGGVIINIASQSAYNGSKTGKSHYASSKGGVVTFTTSVAKEIAQYGMRINAVAPGMLYTDMTAETLDKNIEEYNNKIPLGRIGQTKEIAQVVAFLASDAAGYMTGTTIDVSGGLVGR